MEKATWTGPFFFRIQIETAIMRLIAARAKVSMLKGSGLLFLPALQGSFKFPAHSSQFFKEPTAAG